MSIPLKQGYNIHFAHLRCPPYSEMVSAESYEDFYGLVYAISGKQMVYSSNGITVLRQGDLYFIPRHVHIGGGCVEDKSFEFILLKYTDAIIYDLLKVVGNETYTELCAETVIHLEKKTQEKALSILNEMELEWNNYNSYSELVLRGLLHRMIIMCLLERIIGGMPACVLEKKHDCLSDAIKYIKVHLRENPSLKETAEGIHVSPSYLSKIFISKLHISFSNFILSEKIQFAQKLLVCSKLSMAQIASEAGFSSNTYFSDCFRRNMGISPTQFRNENGGRRNEKNKE